MLNLFSLLHHQLCFVQFFGFFRTVKGLHFMHDFLLLLSFDDGNNGMLLFCWLLRLKKHLSLFKVPPSNKWPTLNIQNWTTAGRRLLKDIRKMFRTNFFYFISMKFKFQIKGSKTITVDWFGFIQTFMLYHYMLYLYIYALNNHWLFK